MPADASKMFGKNVINFLKPNHYQGRYLNLNWEDDIVKGSAVTHNREIVHEKVKAAQLVDSTLSLRNIKGHDFIQKWNNGTRK